MTQVTTKLDQNLIEAVKQYPQTYINGCDIETPAWTAIAEQLKRKQASCTSKWLKILFNYAKIKNLIQSHWVLESVLQAHPVTKAYLNGTLSFLDPYITKLPDRTLPNRIHGRYYWVKKYIEVDKIDNSLKNSTLVTQNMIQALISERENEKYFDDADMTNFMEAAEKAVTQCITTFKNNKQDNINVEDMQTSDMSLETEQVVTEINNYEGKIMSDPLNIDSVEGHVENRSTSSTDTALSNNIVADDIDVKEETLDSDNNTIEISEINSEDSNSSVAEHTDTKLYFKDLSEFVSNRLSLEKQKELRRRISLLVSELLENNESD